ncbi:hypothetical protein BH11MYX1_BH11MYX1_35260 [soil metagenome]
MTYSKLPLLLLVAACGGSDAQLDVSSRDPRCVSACPETMPMTAGVGAVCDTASRTQCLDECEARIAGLPTLCQSCLAERACFGPSGCVGSDPISCDQSSCTLTSEFGSCTYATSDEAAHLACLRTIDPRREVACAPSFRPTSECRSSCP